MIIVVVLIDEFLVNVSYNIINQKRSIELINLNNVFKKKYGGICLPGAESYYEKSLSLPLFPNMLKNDVKYVVQTLTSIINKYI